MAMRQRSGGHAARALAACGVLLLAGCSDSGSGLPNQSPLVIQQALEDDGDGQVGIIGQELPSPVRVLVTRDDQPEAEVQVQWVVGNGGSMEPGTAFTDESGIAEGVWTLGPFLGDQEASARVNGAEGSPVLFEATAGNPPPPPPGGASRRPVP
jgi:hypothetical protein